MCCLIKSSYSIMRRAIGRVSVRMEFDSRRSVAEIKSYLDDASAKMHSANYMRQARAAIRSTFKQAASASDKKRRKIWSYVHLWDNKSLLQIATSSSFFDFASRALFMMQWCLFFCCLPVIRVSLKINFSTRQIRAVSVPALSELAPRAHTTPTQGGPPPTQLHWYCSAYNAHYNQMTSS